MTSRLLQAPLQRYLSKHTQTSVQVTVLGATTLAGQFTSFLLKQNPYLSALHIHGDKLVHNLGADLCFLDTKCQVKSYDGEQNLPNSMKSADIILMMPSDNKKGISYGDRIMDDGRKVHTWAKVCCSYAPRSIVVVCAHPITVTMPIVEAVFKQSHFYHPGRIVGSAAQAQVHANSLLGRSQDLDPSICQVPIVGGPDIDLAVPLFSKAKPIDLFGKDAKDLTAAFRGVRADEFSKTLGHQNAFEEFGLCTAFSTCNLVTNIARGICGDDSACANVYVRSNLVNTCQHLVSTVRFALGGIFHNYGIPQLSPLELQLLEKAALQIKGREKMAEEFVKYVENKEIQLPPFKQREIKEQDLLKQKVYKANTCQ